MSASEQRLTLDGELLRQLRVDAGRRQDEAALAAGLTAARLRQLEHGGQNAQLVTLGRLARTYGIDPCDLLTWTPP